MRRFLISAVIFSLALFVVKAGLCADGASAPKPKIEISPMNHDFGKIDEDVKSKAVFIIKNSGGDKLVIYEVRPSCGCTVTSLTNKELAPGETARLEAEYNSHNASGQVHRAINVMSNDPATPTVTLGFSADVTPKPAPDLTLSSYNITNLLMAKGGKDMRAIKLTSSGQYDLVINELTTSPGISAQLGKVSVPEGKTVKTNMTFKPGEATDLNLTITPKAEAGNFQDIVTIRSNSKKKPVVTFIVQGIIQ